MSEGKNPSKKDFVIEGTVVGSGCLLSNAEDLERPGPLQRQQFHLKDGGVSI